MKLPINQIIQGDCLEVLKTLENESVDCVVTSPPYWALRDYGIEGQLGLEPTFQEYITKLCDIFDEVKRVLKKQGTCWVNLGDTYNSGGNYRKDDDSKARGYAYNRTDYGRCQVDRKLQGLQDKCLCQIPSRFAIEMSNRGWILRNEIIWHKPNCMPSSVKDRFTVDYEKVFFFVKNKKYWFETQYEPILIDSIKRERRGNNINKYTKNDFLPTGVCAPTMSQPREYRGYEDIETEFNSRKGRNKRCVWTITTQPYKEAHFATYPEKLIAPMIKAGCPEFVCKKCGKGREKITEKVGTPKYTEEGNPEGINRSKMKWNDSHPSQNPRWFSEFADKGLTDCGCNSGFSGGVVLDPFFGAGTTGLVADRLGRKWIGIELSEEYIKIANERLRQEVLL